jgi:hypothetical protein
MLLTTRNAAWCCTTTRPAAAGFSRIRALTTACLLLLCLLLALGATSFARAVAAHKARTNGTTRLKSSTYLDRCLNVTGDPAFCTELEYDEEQADNTPEGIAVLWDVYYNGTLTLQSSVVSVFGKCTVEQTGCGIDDEECVNEKWQDLAYSTTQSEWELTCEEQGDSKRVLLTQENAGADDPPRILTTTHAANTFASSTTER